MRSSKASDIIASYYCPFGDEHLETTDELRAPRRADIMAETHSCLLGASQDDGNVMGKQMAREHSSYRLEERREGGKEVCKGVSVDEGARCH
jgi:hypothetical protein